MNKITSFTIYILCFAFMPACSGTILNPPPPENVPCCGENDMFEPTQAQGQSMRGKNDFVNYTEVAADYKAYGERSPRDELVTPAGAGGNVSSVVPPQVDEEVVEYEESMTSLDKSGSSSETASSVEDPVEDWLAEEGRTLKDLLLEWSERSGWRLIWKTNRNYTLTAGAMFRGRFADVSSALIRAFGRARPAPIGTFYKGNRVLVVETLEDENAYE